MQSNNCSSVWFGSARFSSIQIYDQTKEQTTPLPINALDLCAKNSSRAARHFIHIYIYVYLRRLEPNRHSLTHQILAYDGWNEETYRKSKL